MTARPAPAPPPGSARYVVVGAGSAGCVLAARLSERGEGHVVLLEAGGPDRRAEIGIPAGFPALFGTEVDWGYRTLAQPGLGGRALNWPRGKTLGGSSSLNAQIWTRGHRADYDEWAAAGCDGWSAGDVLPYFARSEDRHAEPGDGADAPAGGGAPGGGYGTGGPIRIEDLRDPSPATGEFLAACAAAGLRPLHGDPFAPEGAGPVHTTQRGGRRWSAADAYLRPAMRRGNLTVVPGARVERVVIEHGRATGVAYTTADGPAVVRAEGEVVLAAGAIGSPQLLMLSGIGPADELRRHGIPVAADLPGVGRNLADHLYVPLAFDAHGEVSPGVADPAVEVAEFLRERRGRLTSNIAEAVAFLRSGPQVTAPDLEFVWMVLPFLTQGDDAPRRHGVTLGVVLLTPRSRGTLRLDPADPAGHPLIDPGYLSDPAGEDLRVLTAGVRRAQQVLSDPALAGRLGRALTPGALDPSEQTVHGVVRGYAETLFHPVGTCRMGPEGGSDPSASGAAAGSAAGDGGAVLDLRLRVRGVAGLRVVDASALPSIPRGHTHAPTVMLAERAADLILADADADADADAVTAGRAGVRPAPDAAPTAPAAPTAAATPTALAVYR